MRRYRQQHHTEASGMTERLPCGHYSERDDCPYCEGITPDPWDLVTEDEYRGMETRSYRQTKMRKKP